MIATKAVGPVTLTRDSTHAHAVEGTCQVDGCYSTFVAFGDEAAEVMARRHVLIAHPEIEVPS